MPYAYIKRVDTESFEIVDASTITNLILPIDKFTKYTICSGQDTYEAQVIFYEGKYFHFYFLNFNVNNLNMYTIINVLFSRYPNKIKGSNG